MVEVTLPGFLELISRRKFLVLLFSENTVWSQENGDLSTTKIFGPPEDSL